jgi:hypothetical protein
MKLTGAIRGTIVAAAAVLVLAGTMAFAQQQAPKNLPKVTVYKSATCGCCAKWNAHMTAAGFDVTSNDLPDVTPVKDKNGVPAAVRSCHTALVGPYVVEGHVPADLVKKLLAERPAGVVGIATPGMPMGSPGMEGASKDTYNVVTFDKTGKTTVYATR